MFQERKTMSKDDIQTLVASDEKFRYFVIQEFMNQRERISKLEVKSGLWGALAGMSVVLLAKLKGQM